jgi:two-component system, OmpR family, sensor histidine kinase CpxA
MKLPVSIFGKILLLFVVNVALLGGMLVWGLREGWGMTALPAFRSERLGTVGNELLRSLERLPMAQWNGLLAKASERHGVTFYLFSTDGPLLAGPEVFLPGNVHNEITVSVDGFVNPAGGPPMGGPPPDDRPDGLLPLPPPPVDMNAKPILVSNTGYWCYLRGELKHAEGSGRVALVTWSDSPTGHGFYADTRVIYWTMAAMVVASALLWAPFVRRYTRRLSDMRHTARELAKGNFQARAEEVGSDELGALGRSVNHMADQIGSMVEGQKRLLGDIAHELSAPIARMQAVSGIIESQGKTDEKYVTRLHDELQHMGALVQELLSLSKASLSRCVELRPVHLRQQVERVVARERQNGETIVVEVPESAVVMSEPELLTRAIGNVLRNAIRYAGKAGPITIEARVKGDQAFIVIRDQGPGVPEESLPRLFDAFYRPDLARTREAGGAGLGLAIVKSCVQATRGNVSVKNREGGGLVVEIEQLLARGGEPGLS